jgi:hypothetical protein
MAKTKKQAELPFRFTPEQYAEIMEAIDCVYNDHDVYVLWSPEHHPADANLSGAPNIIGPRGIFAEYKKWRQERARSK